MGSSFSFEKKEVKICIFSSYELLEKLDIFGSNIRKFENEEFQNGKIVILCEVENSLNEKYSLEVALIPENSSQNFKLDKRLKYIFVYLTDHVDLGFGIGKKVSDISKNSSLYTFGFEGKFSLLHVKNEYIYSMNSVDNIKLWFQDHVIGEFLHSKIESVKYNEIFPSNIKPAKRK
jgi:hypothetical protein